MKPVFYDLHMHSCLSPCGSPDMTPNNIYNMSLIKELDMIALTDHNSAKNCPALMKLSEGGDLVVIPGMELNTEEEIHVVCLFPALENAMDFDRYVGDRLLDIQNDPDIFGEQVIMDEQDRPVGVEKKLLINATSISISDTPALVAGFGGICYPAHIDRSSNSILSNLGFVPPECKFRTMEVKNPDGFFAKEENLLYKEEYYIVTSSDAHYLEDIAERERCIHMDTIDFAGLAARIG